MDIFSTDGYDGLRDGSHHLDRKITKFDLSKFHEVFYRPFLEHLLGFDVWGPNEFPIAAAVSVTTVTKDGMFYLGGHTNTGWDMKAGTLVFNDNHAQLWQRDKEGRARLRVGDVFFEEFLPCGKENDWSSLNRFVIGRVQPRVSHLRNEQREVVNELLKRLTAAQKELALREDQLLSTERQYMHVHFVE